MSDLNRREFVTIAAATAAAVCAACTGNIFAAEENPKDPPRPATGPAFATGPVDVGPKTDYATDGVFDKFAKSNRVLIVRHEGKIYSPSATCTHKNAALKVKDGNIVCPSHGSKFSIQGTSTKGPAKGSLYRYALSVDDKGHIIVDKSKQFEEKTWDDPAASITA